ncbi:DUF2975 domain-containing protein [Escherichia marmotae]|jgi:hypothetical protein|nr:MULTISPECIES: DUF2975 domain-containing protein [Escherichia]EEZ9763473.1 DUF2975 domain-containing protein [Escherichia coli O115]EJO8045637.1 DUF2975 domain-containing protein [Salmonella enterica]MEC9522713.1 DUF2975 domain-containing protein [Escherichia marmotae]HAI1252608.1 DUF2975 domain-containing protein [Escherichia coli O25b:H4-ST131]HBY5067556.1 DUF2975 domain-containing protein [Klebsiella pneumoniae]
MPDDNKKVTAEFDKDLLRRLQQAEQNLITASAALGDEGCWDEESHEPESVEDAVDEMQKEEEDAATMQRLDLSSLNFQIAELSRCVETISTNLESVQAETKRKNAETDGLLTDNELRRTMADKTYQFMIVWCCFVGWVIFMYVLKKDFDPPETIIIALMGTTTVSIVGLVGFVVSGLFKSNNKPSGDNKN